MNVCVTLMQRFERTPDGAIWTRSNDHYAELRNYLGVFETARMLARVRDVAAPPASGRRADGDCISFTALPYYVGPWQFCRRWLSVRRAALRGIGESDAVILNLPSPISALIEPALRRQHRPFAARLLGDPWDLYSPGALHHPLRPLIRWWFTRSTAAMCRHACGVNYVTNQALQRRYPSAPGAFQVGVSDVNLPSTAFAGSPRLVKTVPAPLRLIFVGSLEFPYKGADILIHALRQCVDSELDVRLTIVGDGSEHAALASLAAQLGIEDRIGFRGMLPAGEKVMSALDDADLFILPSRVEGMPRAMIEAMARALPCIGSDVGGIPELLDREDLVPAGDIHALAEKILEVGTSPARMEHMSARCLERAQEFHLENLRSRQQQFFLLVRDATEVWKGSRLSYAAC